MAQTGAQEESPVPGKMMNCHDFGTYEPEGSRTPHAAMCHGGLYLGDSYNACPVKAECRNLTISRRHRLPVLVEDRKPLVTPPPQSAKPEERRNPFLMPPFKMPGLGEMPTQIPQAKTAQATPVQTPTVNKLVEELQAKINEVRSSMGLFPGAVIPAVDAPHGMRTPYAAPTAVPAGVSPTYLPQEGESVWRRLLKNILQGLLAALGWHVFDYSRSIDLFA